MRLSGLSSFPPGLSFCVFPFPSSTLGNACSAKIKNNLPPRLLASCVTKFYSPGWFHPPIIVLVEITETVEQREGREWGQNAFISSRTVSLNSVCVCVCLLHTLLSLSLFHPPLPPSTHPPHSLTLLNVCSFKLSGLVYFGQTALSSHQVTVHAAQICCWDSIKDRS